MSSISKKSAKSTASKKRPSPAHPSFIVMISECIVNSDEARTGVSRPTIKKYLEETYKLEITPGVNTNINRAIISGEDKGTFVLPKGPSGKVKLAPKVKAEVASDTKENKPVKKATPAAKKPAAKAPAKKISSPAKAKAVKKSAAAKTKTTTKTTAAAKKTTTAKRAAPAKKAAAPAKKPAAAARKAPAKKTPASKSKAAASKPKTATKRKAPTVRKA